MLEISYFRFALTFSVTYYVIVSRTSGEIAERELDCGTELFRDRFLPDDGRFVNSVDFRLCAMINTIEDGISKWYLNTPFEGGDNYAINFVINYLQKYVFYHRA